MARRRRRMALGLRALPRLWRLLWLSLPLRLRRLLWVGLSLLRRGAGRPSGSRLLAASRLLLRLSAAASAADAALPGRIDRSGGELLSATACSRPGAGGGASSRDRKSVV